MIHGLVAMACFVTAPLSAIAAYRLVNKPFAYFASCLRCIFVNCIVFSGVCERVVAIPGVRQRGRGESGRLPCVAVDDRVWRLSNGLLSNQCGII